MSFLPRQTIVVPVDFSSASAPAVRTAVELAGSPAGVHVVHVIPALNPVSPLGIFGDDDVEEKLQAKAMTYLEAWLSSQEIEGVQANIQSGEAGNRIVEYADSQTADLIVIPSHGHSGLTRALLGSVAERVIRHANCPTLILRRDDADS